MRVRRLAAAGAPHRTLEHNAVATDPPLRLDFLGGGCAGGAGGVIGVGGESGERAIAGYGGVAGESFPVGRSEVDRWIERYRSFDRLCARRNRSLLRHVSSADTARDLDRLRAAVGDRRLSYVGGSYGTFLGATYANLFPG